MSFLLYGIMRYGQSGSGCDVTLVKVACDKKDTSTLIMFLTEELY